MAYKIRTDHCLACHYCALECPEKAIYYVGTHYEIDPTLCVECGVCHSVCNVDAIDTGAPEVVQPHRPRTLEADIVVLGCGTGGAVAALRAAQLTGGRVIVLEKAKKPGGSGWFAGMDVTEGELGPAGMPVGSGAPSGTADAGEGVDAMQAMFLRKRDESWKQQLDQDLLKAAAQASLDCNRWLCAMPAIQAEMVEVNHFGKLARGLPGDSIRLKLNTKCTDNAIGPGRTGSFVIQTLLDQFPDYGIQLLTRHQAVSLLLDKTGAVRGVTARDPGGETTISCRAVICTVGGFTGNDELIRKTAPWFFSDDPDAEPVHRFAAPSNTGDIVPLAQSAAAYVDYDSMSVSLFGPVHHPFTFSLFKACLEGENMTVNLAGRRFFNEVDFAGAAAPFDAQPRHVSYAVYSEPVLLEVFARMMKNSEGISVAHWQEDLAEELAHGNVSLKKADTLEELADKAGIDRAGFLETVARYNRFCKYGVDQDFGKPKEKLRALENGPFYAIFGKLATDGAIGGVLVDSACRVKREDRQDVIPGLFAAGDCTGGVGLQPKGPGDDRHVALGGMSWASGGGYLCAQSAAEYLNTLGIS